MAFHAVCSTLSFLPKPFSLIMKTLFQPSDLVNKKLMHVQVCSLYTVFDQIKRAIFESAIRLDEHGEQSCFYVY